MLSLPNTNYARVGCQPSFSGDDVFRFVDGEMVRVPTIDNIPVTYLSGDGRSRSGETEAVDLPYVHVPSEDDWVTDSMFYSILDRQRRVPPLSSNFDFIQTHGASARFGF